MSSLKLGETQKDTEDKVAHLNRYKVTVHILHQGRIVLNGLTLSVHRIEYTTTTDAHRGPLSYGRPHATALQPLWIQNVVWRLKGVGMWVSDSPGAMLTMPDVCGNDTRPPAELLHPSCKLFQTSLVCLHQNWLSLHTFM